MGKQGVFNISIYKITKKILYLRYSESKIYSFARFIMRRIYRPAVTSSQTFLSYIFSKIGLILVWDQYSAVSNFSDNRFLVFRGLNGMAFFGKSLYISRGIILYQYRQSARMRQFGSNIIDATGNNLLPLAMLESALVKEGTFQIRKKISFGSKKRTHVIGGGGKNVLLPNNDYLLFGHFLPQLVPYLIRENGISLAVNLVCPDNINRNFEILEYFDVFPKNKVTFFRSLSVIRVATQVGLYPAKTELNLLKSIHSEKFAAYGKPFSDKRLRLYLTRAVAHDGRKVLNEQEVLEQIRPLGFLVIDPSTLEYAEAARLFANAELVIGPYGSAFFHTLSMKKGSTIIEFSGNKFIRWHLKKMAVDTYINHKLIINESSPEHDIFLNIPILLQVLNETIEKLES